MISWKRIGVDIGGTFTDVATVEHDGRLRIGKRLTTHGNEEAGVFADVLEIGKASRPDIFNLKYRRDPVLVLAEQRFELDERVYASGEVARRPTVEELKVLAAK